MELCLYSTKMASEITAHILKISLANREFALLLLNFLYHNILKPFLKKYSTLLAYHSKSNLLRANSIEPIPAVPWDPGRMTQQYGNIYHNSPGHFLKHR